MVAADALTTYVTRLGDTALLLSQRLTELVTHGPELEEELATANFALDYLGQARLFYSYLGELEGKGRDEDDFAFHRDASEFRNLLLVELPNGHFGDTIVRQVLFNAYYVRLLEALSGCSDTRLADIARRAVKEVRYHHRHASMWFLRLGDGTPESHARMKESLDRHWRYTGEMFAGDAVDEIVRSQFDGPDLDAIRQDWSAEIEALAAEATLRLPTGVKMAEGSRRGVHTEHRGYLIAEMQHLPRVHAGAAW